MRRRMLPAIDREVGRHCQQSVYRDHVRSEIDRCKSDINPTEYGRGSLTPPSGTTATFSNWMHPGTGVRASEKRDPKSSKRRQNERRGAGTS